MINITSYIFTLSTHNCVQKSVTIDDPCGSNHILCGTYFFGLRGKKREGKSELGS